MAINYHFYYQCKYRVSLALVKSRRLIVSDALYFVSIKTFIIHIGLPIKFYIKCKVLLDCNFPHLCHSLDSDFPVGFVETHNLILFSFIL